MKTIKSKLYSAILLSFLFLTACGGTTDPSEAYKGETSDQIFQDGEKALIDKNYSEAIKHFEALDVQYPFDRNTEISQFHIIYAYYMNSDYVSAEASADRFIHSHPTNPHIDYAYYMRGLSDYYQNLGMFERLFSVDYATRDLTQVKKSYNDFSQLTTQFPDSRYAPAAHQYMIYLRNVLATHQLEVAEYYFNREAYVGAANRAAGVVQHYQGSPNVPDALVMMAKSYHNLHQTALENEIIHVLVYNYPNSKYVQEVTTGNEADSKKFSVVARPEQAIPPPAAEQVMPPESMSVARYHHVHKASEAIVREEKVSAPVVVPPQERVPVQPVAPTTPAVVTPAAKPAMAPASAAKSAPQNAIHSNGDRGSSGFVDVREAIDKISASDFFHVTPKKNPASTQQQDQQQNQPQPSKKPKHKHKHDSDQDQQSHETLRSQTAVAASASDQPVVVTEEPVPQYPVLQDNGQRR